MVSFILIWKQQKEFWICMFFLPLMLALIMGLITEQSLFRWTFEAILLLFGRVAKNFFEERSIYQCMISRFFCAPFHFTLLFIIFLQLSLFFDILLCLAENVTESAFVSGERSGSYGCSTRMGTKCSSKDDMMIMKAGRNLLWKKLRGTTLKGGTRKKRFLGIGNPCTIQR